MVPVVATFLGFYIGGLIVSSSMRWAWALHQTIGEYRLARRYPHLGSTPHLAPIVAATFLYSAPWVIVGVIYGVVKVLGAHPDWGYWFLGGVCLYLVLVGPSVFQALRGHRAASQRL